MTWKPGDKFTLAKRVTSEDATILKVVTLAGIREFALYEDGTTLGTSSPRFMVAHIPTGYSVGHGAPTRNGAIRSAAAIVGKKGGAPAIRAAIERRAKG